jgi:aquaporin Z
MIRDEETRTVSGQGPFARYEQSVITRLEDLQDPRQEWRRLFSEVFDTFL